MLDAQKAAAAIVEALNAAVAEDVNAIRSLILHRELSAFPVDGKTTLVVDTDERGEQTIGPLGLLNGALIAAGIPRVAARFDEVDELQVLLGFEVYPPDVRQAEQGEIMTPTADYHDEL